MQTPELSVKPMKVIIAAIVLAVITLWATWAFAQSHIQLTSVAEVQREMVTESGKKEMRRLPATKVMPGETVIFTTYYENTSEQIAENAVITNPIPEHMQFVPGSAQGVNTKITYSIDGGKTYKAPEKLIVVDKAGRQFPARPQDYTHIRWTVVKPLAPGAKGAVSFRATIK